MPPLVAPSGAPRAPLTSVLAEAPTGDRQEASSTSAGDCSEPPTLLSSSPMTITACPACGITNRGDQTLCLACGTLLPRGAPAPRQTPPAASAPAPQRTPPAQVPVPPPPPGGAPASVAAVTPTVNPLPSAQPSPLPAAGSGPIASHVPVPQPVQPVSPATPAVNAHPAPAPMPHAAQPPFEPTHIVPAAGLETRARPDPALAVGPPLPPYLEVQVIATTGAWSNIRCSNQWTAWVDGRLLIPRQY